MYRLKSVEALLEWRERFKGTLGFVPTMGDLHIGHVSLIERSVSENAGTLVSIYVNPTQFNDASDYAEYDRPLERDLERCEQAGVSAVFLPDYEMLYPDGYRYRVTEMEKSLPLEGQSRPGHFDGVLTVVLKLLLLARANAAYFGEKDWQQLQLIKGLRKAFLLPTRICAVPTVREADGLAFSSRNARLSESSRALAPRLYATIMSAPSATAAKRSLAEQGFTVEYVADVSGRRLAAVELDGVRLIDNVSLVEGEA